MVCTRYAQGFLIVEKFLKYAMLCRFIDKLFEYVNETRAWEYWLYKDTCMSWNDFKLAVVPQDADVPALKNAEFEIEKALWEGVIKSGTI